MVSRGDVDEGIIAPTLNWEKDGDRWRSDQWPGIGFTFDRADPDPKWYLSGVDNPDLLHLQKALLHSTGLHIQHISRQDSRYTYNELQQLDQAFAGSDDPTPALQIVEFSRVNFARQDVFFRAAQSRKLRNLRDIKLDFDDSFNVNKIETRFLAEAIEAGNLPSFEKLHISNTSKCIMPSVTEYIVNLAASLGQNGCNLRSLYFDVNVGTRAHFAVAQSLKFGTLVALEEFRLEGPVNWPICGKGYANALSSGRLPSLKSLILSQASLDDKGGEFIADALRSGKMTSLEKLDLSVNYLRDAGLCAVASCLEAGACPSLRLLNIKSFIRFSTFSFEALSKALQSGHLNNLERILVDVPSEECGRLLVRAFARNHSLTALVEYSGFQKTKRELNELRERNIRQAGILAELGPSVTRQVRATRAKVYLCGGPNMGKTTLQKSMRRGYWKAMSMAESGLHGEERTRGINVVNMTAQGNNAISLAIWDMAGQEEFHLLHYAFFQNLAAGDEKETSFVVVSNTDQSFEDMKMALDYWMRFISSTCTQGIHDPRNVFAVLNLSQGKSQGKVEFWKACLEDARKNFEGHLQINSKCFVGDLRKRSQVMDLKECLLEHSGKMLKDKFIPNICEQIQRHLKLWVAQNQLYPIFSWEKFLEKAKQLEEKAKQLEDAWLEPMFKSALKYLNEIGVIIYIASSNIIVLDPDWICSTIVGNMLVPNDREFYHARKLEHLFRTSVNHWNGSIHVLTLKKFFKTKLSLREWQDSELDNLVTILLWLGLCYKGPDDLLFIPSLIQEVGTQGDYWEAHHLEEQDEENEWVMGYSIQQKTQDMGFAPIKTLWHRLQVDLGQKYGTGASQDTHGHDFSVGKSFVVFKEQEMMVRIEAEEGQINTTFGNITFMVKPLDHCLQQTRVGQLDLASQLVEILLKLWVHICPGVGYMQRVIWPWPICKPLKDEEVQLGLKEWSIEVDEVMEKVLEYGVGTQFADRRVGRCHTIMYDELLTTKELDNIKNISSGHNIEIRSIESQDS